MRLILLLTGLVCLVSSQSTGYWDWTSSYNWFTESTTEQTTALSTTQVSTTSATSWIPWWTTQSASTPAPTLNQCSCTDSNIWLDVYILIDSSFAMTDAGFDTAVSFVQSVLYKMTIGQGSGQQTRVGFITYAANAKKKYDLTAFRSKDDMINADFSYDGSRGTNIEDGIQQASMSFDSSSHRDNAQKVIVIVASAYEKGSYNDPTAAADAFKEDGGYIITVEYLQEHGEAIPLLASLSSGPQFRFTNQYGNLTAEQIRQAFCEANCFCPTNYNPYNQDYSVPVGGCYRPVPISAIQVLAAKNCRQHHDASLTKVENRDKSLFLSTLFPAKTKFWIGLKYAFNGNYQWADGTTLRNNDYQMWAPGYPNSAMGECVYMYQYSGFSFGWFNDDCSDDQNYVCQSVPCSANNYCTTRD